MSRKKVYVVTDARKRKSPAVAVLWLVFMIAVVTIAVSSWVAVHVH